MLNLVRRIYVEKRPGFDVEAKSLLDDLRDNLGVVGLQNLRLVNRYDIAGITDAEYAQGKKVIFAEPPVDQVSDEVLPINQAERVFAMEYLPGQYDQRADSAAQCVQMLTQKERPIILSAKVIILQGEISDADFSKVKDYCINPVESREAVLEKPQSLAMETVVTEDVETVTGFMAMDEEALSAFLKKMGLAMSREDLAFCQNYFIHTEKRDPTITEIKLIDTYWSDHCRHTTFFTKIEAIDIAEGRFSQPVRIAYEEYLKSRSAVYGAKDRDICLMDIAVIAMKELRAKGQLPDLDSSDEINACSIVVDVDVAGEKEPWLVMFKNETHNHPTEIEPFGGAATCLGGAIRDPLSGRSYVYQAMRVTGSGDPRTKIEDTIPGKLPQRKITTGAAGGYSSYGNQIGLATGQVTEVYDEGFVAKRMEIGAVIAAAPQKNVVREAPVPGDVVLLVGGKTGRDGCGGATGSSKEHTKESLLTCGAEVQKGNPPTERKIQRLFRNAQVSTLIKRCNDFGAGGVSVAIGELTDGLEINLDAVPKKYEGLDGTELAISESQERMAVVVAPENVTSFKQFAEAENLEATVVAKVTAANRLQMFWRGQAIVDVSREFLNTNGVKQKTKVIVNAPLETENCFEMLPDAVADNLGDVQKAWLANLQDLNVCSQKGLVERFDSTIGAATVLMPFGGKYQATPAEGMVAKLPVLKGETTTATAMTFGYQPQLAKWSPFHGGLYAVVESVSRLVALGCNYNTARLTLQEYFQKLGQDATRWGKPFSALLGAFYAQKKLAIPAIGGKDSMSGTFMDRHVPPTLVSFAVNVMPVENVISQEFKGYGNPVVLISLGRDEAGLPDFEIMKQNFTKIHQLIQNGQVLASHTVRNGGLAAAVSKMAFGNRIGIRFCEPIAAKQLFLHGYGAILLELKADVDLKTAWGEVNYQLLGYTQEKPVISVNEKDISVEEALVAWEKPLERIFPTQTEELLTQPREIKFEKRNTSVSAIKTAQPKVLIPVFPGTNCEYDSARAFEKAGATVETLVIRNMTVAGVEESIAAMVQSIEKSQIIMLPGGFSAGDEPDGSGKFIATLFRNPRIKEAVMNLLHKRDGLMLGICNGFQALIKLGLVPYGEIRDIDADCPTLTFNKIGRHVSCMAQTKVASTLSPWFSNVEVGDIHTIALSHGEGRFIAKEAVLDRLIANGQVATQYVDFNSRPSGNIRFNPNGSYEAIEGITSPDGRILGKMGHSERIGHYVTNNVPGNKDQKLFEAGVRYFK